MKGLTLCRSFFKIVCNFKKTLVSFVVANRNLLLKWTWADKLIN